MSEENAETLRGKAIGIDGETVLKTLEKKAKELVEQKEGVDGRDSDFGRKERLQSWCKQALERVQEQVPEDLAKAAFKELKQRMRDELLKEPLVTFTRKDTLDFLNMLEERSSAHFYVHSSGIRKWIDESSARVAIGIQKVTGCAISPTVYVVCNSDIASQAFAFGSDAVIIELSLLEMLESQDELDFILAHEFAHIALNHMVTRLNFDEVGKQTLGKLFDRISKKSGGLFDGKLFQLRCVIGKFLEDQALKALCHSDEFEADEVACKVLHDIGGQRNAGETFMQRFRSRGMESATHPSVSERIIRMNKMIQFEGNPPARDFPLGIRRGLKTARKVVWMKKWAIRVMGFVTSMVLFAGCSFSLKALHWEPESAFLKLLASVLVWDFLKGGLVISLLCGSWVGRWMYRHLR